MISLVMMALMAATAQPVSAPHESGTEQRLAVMVNSYRANHGLPPVPVSRSLNAVAQAHVWDLTVNQPDDSTRSDNGRCTLHSWSARGHWSSVCYTEDGSAASAMWSKPREITRGAYPGNGYEIAVWSSGALTPELALSEWEKSPSHDTVIREAGEWKNANWQAMGVAVSGHYAVIWFGEEPDTAQL